MLVVSNTSPISNLAIIGRLDLLNTRYGVVRISPMVAKELAQLTHANGKARIDTAIADGWLQLDDTAAITPPLPLKIDAGELSAIALALAINADVLLIDEKRGRIAARHVGLIVSGILGELLHAKYTGRLPHLKYEMERLRKEAGFFIAAEIERFILSQAGE
jgi:predicted nucleic acid-binding protein